MNSLKLEQIAEEKGTSHKCNLVSVKEYAV